MAHHILPIKNDNNTFGYRFSNLSEEVTFQIQGNDYVSKNYKLLVHPSPRVFELQSIIDYQIILIGLMTPSIITGPLRYYTVQKLNGTLNVNQQTKSVFL